MFKKVLLVCLALFGILFFQSTAECFDESEYYTKEGLSTSERARQFYTYVRTKWPENEIWVQMSETMTIIGDNNDAVSQAAIDKLVADYSANQYLPWALLETGVFCRLINKPQIGLDLNQRVINNWPSHESSMWSLKDVAMLNIEFGNIEAARTATDTAFTRFAQNQWIASIGNEIADRYIKFGKYEDAKQVCQYVVEHWPDNYYTNITRGKIEQIDMIMGGWTLTQTQINAQRDMAMSYIQNDMMDDANTIIDELVSDCSTDPRCADAIFKIGLCCQEEGRYEKALELHQYLVNTWPQHAMAMWSQSCVAICHIALGNMDAAEADTNKLLSSFSSSEHIAEAVYDIARQYDSSDQYQNAIQIFEMIIRYWPDCKYAWSAQSWIGVCYEKLKGTGSLAEQEANALIEDAYLKVIANYPNCPSIGHAALKLGYLTASQTRWPEAAAYFELFIDAAPDDARVPNVLYDLGRAYENANEPNLAISSYAQFIEAADPNSPIVKELMDRFPQLATEGEPNAH
jgi:tetratricopeptide (TPR) repeat protein